MKINIVNIGNKEWIDFKSDISIALYWSLRDLSHDVVMSVNQFETDRVNLLIGADFIANDMNAIQTIIKSKIDYIIFEVESYDGYTINGRKEFNNEAYKLLLEYSKLIITPYLENINSYLGEYKNKLTYMRWGFHQSMVSEKIIKNTNLRYDGIFFGLLKGERAEKIEKLKSITQINLKILTRQDPIMLRDYYVSCAKWGLNLSYGSNEKFINPFRLYYMMANGVPVMADGGRDEDRYLSICEVVSSDDMGKALLKARPHPADIMERCREHKLNDNLKLVI